MSLSDRAAVTPSLPRMGSMTLAGAVLIALATAAIALVYSKHQSRKLFVELQSLSQQRDALNIEWDRLLLEQGNYAAHSLIESKAGGPLGLKRPASSEIFLISDTGDYRFVGLEPVPADLVRLMERDADTVAEVSP